MVDKALGFDRKKFDDLERQQGIADDKTLSAEERETQSKDLAAQRDAMLKEAMDRLTGNPPPRHDDSNGNLWALKAGVAPLHGAGRPWSGLRDSGAMPMAMAVVCTALIWSLGDEGELGWILHLEGQGMVNPLEPDGLVRLVHV
jgi:hypothetical protein